MSPLERLVKNTYLTLHPGVAAAPCGATRYRWEMHVALPFCLPATSFQPRKVTIEQRDYEVSLCNYMDRVTVYPPSAQAIPSVSLVHRGHSPTHRAAPGSCMTRESLQSVACYHELVEANDPALLFDAASDKVRACFRHLSELLSSIQRSMPYLVSWQVYPLSQFDVGLVYHAASHFCPTSKKWEPLATGVTINLARQLHQPLCTLQLDNPVTLPAPLELSHELLAEAQVALFRGLLRTTVLNSYQAVESFANHIFKKKQIAAFEAAGKSAVDAETEAEGIRKDNRTKIKFLTHVGLEPVSGRSLFREEKQLYDDLCKLNDLRNQVAHAGRNPTQVEAEEGYTLCCNVLRWLCQISDYPDRPLLPDDSSVAVEVSSLPSDINAVPASGKAFLLWALGHAACVGIPHPPHQSRLQMRIGDPNFQGTGADQV